MIRVFIFEIDFMLYTGYSFYSWDTPRITYLQIHVQSIKSISVKQSISFSFRQATCTKSYVTELNLVFRGEQFYIPWN